MTGTINGVQINEPLFLLGGIMAEILISMVLICRVLNYKVNRWANIITGVLMIAFVINNGVKDLDDIFFASIEIFSLSLIIWIAYKWHNSIPVKNNY